MLMLDQQEKAGSGNIGASRSSPCQALDILPANDPCGLESSRVVSADANSKFFCGIIVQYMAPKSAPMPNNASNMPSWTGLRNYNLGDGNRCRDEFRWESQHP